MPERNPETANVDTMIARQVEQAEVEQASGVISFHVWFSAKYVKNP